MKYPTKLEAAREWVRGFNAFPYSMIDTLMREHPDDWREVTAPQSGDQVWVYAGTCHTGELLGYDKEADNYVIELDNGDQVVCNAEDFEVEHFGLPMWGTLWQFDDSIDNEWLERHGIKSMSECGFRIYQSDDYGYFFGIDGAGYDFYEQHFLPLYDKRGLHWHIPQADKEGW